MGPYNYMQDSYKHSRDASKQRRLRIACFVVAFLSIFSASYVYTFAIYLSALKATFDFTQSQVEFVMSMTFVGTGGTFPVGVIVQKFGVRSGAVLGFVLPTLAYLLIWSATLNPTFYHDHQYLLGSYFFLGGLGSGAIYITAMTTTLRNFSEAYHGRVSGALISAYNIGVCFYFAIYEGLFVNGYIDEPGQQNLGGFFLFTAIASGLVNGMGPCIYGYYPSSDTSDKDDGEVFLTEEESVWQPNLYGSIGQHPVSRTSESEELSVGQLLTTSTFHYLIWPAVIMLAFEPVNVGNLSTYLYSFGLEAYATTLPYISPGLSIILKLSIGWSSDILLERLHRVWWVLFASCLKVVTYLLGMFLLDRLTVLVLDLILWDVSVVCVVCTMPALIAEEFGTRMFATSWGLAYFATACLTFGLQNAFGVLYDIYVTEGSMCYGLMCFAWSFLIGVALSVLAILFTILYLKQRQIVLWRKYSSSLTSPPT